MRFQTRGSELELAKLTCAFYFTALDMTPFSFPGMTVFVWVPDFARAARFQQPFCIAIRQLSFNILCSSDDTCKCLDDLPVKFNSSSRGYFNQL